MTTVTVERTTSAPIETVFEVLTDHEGYARITPLRGSKLEKKGTPHANGVGAVRVLSLVGPPIREEVTSYESPNRFGYRLLSGLPVRDHTGEVRLRANGSGTTVTYTMTSTPKLPVPSPVFGIVLKQLAGTMLSGVIKESERRR